jgi:hypothetical protein
MGNLAIRKSEQCKRETHEENAISVLASGASNPHISSTDIECESGISRRVLWILHQHKFHP